MHEVITEEEMLLKVAELVESYGTNRKAAEALGIPESSLSEIRNGRQSISKTILEKLGYRKTKFTVNFYLKTKITRLRMRTKRRNKE